jgi:alkyldihydroxyacetonephosphate synthase
MARLRSWYWPSNPLTMSWTPGAGLQCCADHGGVPEAAGQWRNAFIRMPYGREKMIPRGIVSDTFETAITCDRFETFHD